MGVLGSMLLDPAQIVGECVERIKPEAFYHPAHQTIFEILVEHWSDPGKPGLDLITLTQVLKDRNLLDRVGGAAYVTKLFTFVPTAANVSFYLDIVREKQLLRRIINTCTECVSRAYEEQGEINSLLDEVEQKVFAISEERQTGGVQEMSGLVLEAIEAIEKIYERKGQVSGISTGFSDLDKMTNGLHPSQMLVIAARPSMGKTAFSMNVVEHVALELKLPVAVFSLEMSCQQLVQRLICSQARVNLQKVRDGYMGQQDFHTLTTAASRLGESKILIDDTAGISILELRAKARRMKAQHNIQLIVIDYLQLLRSDSKRGQENRQLEISEISAGIKALAKDLDLPIIVLAQLNRQPEGRGGRPRLSDLRESGSIEQDADVVALLVREEVYKDDEEEKEKVSGMAELIIAKQRNGPVGEIPLTFLKEYTRFEDRARTPEEG